METLEAQPPPDSLAPLSGSCPPPLEIGAAASGPFRVDVDLFEGPIDLLLHLVKRNELPLEKVSLAKVAAQFLACIEVMKGLDLEIAGEYLVVASTLVSIKSAMILQKPVELVVDDEGNVVDPHEELLRRVKETAALKDAARALSTLPYLDIDLFGVFDRSGELPTPEAPLAQHDAFLLGKALARVLKKLGEEGKLLTIEVDAVSVVERMMAVVERLRAATAPVAFEKIIPDITSRSSLVGSFLAVLELCKRGMLVLSQSGPDDEVLVGLRERDGELTVHEGEITSADEVVMGEQELRKRVAL